MLKREMVFAVLAASLLTVGTAKADEAGTTCLDTCENTFGSAIIVSSPSGSSVKGLVSCTSTSTRNADGSVTTTTTCSYV